MNPRTIHVVVLPSPFQGHMNPAIHLSIYLASKGLTVTVIITEDIYRQISTTNKALDGMLSGHWKSRGLDLRCAIVSDGLPLEFDRSGNQEQFFLSLLEDMMIHVEETMAKLSREWPPVSCVIADTFSAKSAANLAEKFKLVHASFWTESSMVFSIYSHVQLLRDRGHYPSNDLCKDSIDYIPGVASLRISDLPSYLQPPHDHTIAHRVVFESFESVKSADFVLGNSIQELEQTTVSALSELNISFVPIGPVHALNGGNHPISSSLCPESNCTDWLDSKPPGSVLYVSFGSLFGINPAEREEIVRGMILSQCNFLWIVGSNGQNSLPEYLLDQLSDRGLFVSWCCQTKVLSHPAVSGFLTHCGWNSILESLWCEVPMLAFPIFTDQFSNRKLIVDEWRIALDLGRREKLISREEVAEKITELMTGETGKVLKKQIQILKGVMERAISPEGSSQRNLQHFFGELKKRAAAKAMINSLA